MELSVKDWMIIVGVLLLAAVLFDGLRRVINDRRNNIRMRAKPVYHEDRVDLDLTSHEIAGNARIVLRADGTPMPLREQKVPVLLEPAEDLKGKKTRRKKKEKIEHVEPVFSDSFDDSPQLTIDAFADETIAPAKPAAPIVKKVSPYQPLDEGHYDDREYDDEDQAADAALNEVLAQQSAAYSRAPEVSRSQSSYTQSAEPGVERALAKATQAKATQTKATQEQDVVVMHVLARDNAGFKGADLMQLLLGCGMRYGKMNIFHRYEEGSTEEIQFSVANLVEPGTFDLDALHHFTTPGISFFMTLPGPEKPLQAFDYMAATAQEIARHLDGDIYDERKRQLNDALIIDRRLSIQHYADHAATA